MNRRKGLILVVLICAAAAGYYPFLNLLLATRLALAVRTIASGETSAALAAKQMKVQRRMGDHEIEGVVYWPAGSLPQKAVLLIAGVSELGCYHPRLIAMARTLADKGFLVFTPDIVMFRQFRVSPEVLDEIAFWYSQMRGLPGAEKVRRVGMAGISFSGTLALMAAARPDVRDSVAFTLGIGSYHDLLRCSRAWFAAGPRTVAEGYFPTRFYAKWIIMLAALDLLPVETDRRFLGDTLWKLLLQKSVPPPPGDLTPQGLRWYRLAMMREDQTDPDLVQAIENHLAPRLYRQLSPNEALANLRCPVFLVHGAYDDLIPPEESVQLQKRVAHSRSYMLISPFLTHTHPLQRPLSWTEKARAGFAIVTFFYHFADTVQ